MVAAPSQPDHLANADFLKSAKWCEKWSPVNLEKKWAPVNFDEKWSLVNFGRKTWYRCTLNFTDVSFQVNYADIRSWRTIMAEFRIFMIVAELVW